MSSSNDAAHDAGEVAFAQVGREHADAHGAALAQRAGKVIGPVVEALAASSTRLRVSCGMDFADGELLRTSETVVCESSRCSASIRRLTCPDGVESLPFAMLEVVTRFWIHEEQ